MNNFIVSARKYRPATFVSVVGQSHITSTLKNAITRGQLAHAYLFCGPRGVGKTTCARIFAKAINCLRPRDGEACNECESCRAFNEGRSFNIHELDAASNNSVDDIRNLTEQVRIPPQVGRYSVYIIDEVHMLSLSAFNAFLKTLEEPPAHAVFILATTEKHKIIPTILSRCQIYDFNRIRVEDGVKYLKYIAGEEGVSFDEEALHIIAQKADGGMRDALSMFDKVVSFCGNELSAREVADTLNVLDYDTYFRVTDLILTGDYPQVLLLFDEVLRKGFGGQTFVAGLNAHMRNLLMCKNPQTASLLEVTGSVAARYVEQAARWNVPALFGAIDLLTALDGGFRTATNQRLHVELGLLKLSGLTGAVSGGGQPSPVLPEKKAAVPSAAGNRTAPAKPAPEAKVSSPTPADAGGPVPSRETEPALNPGGESREQGPEKAPEAQPPAVGPRSEEKPDVPAGQSETPATPRPEPVPQPTESVRSEPVAAPADVSPAAGERPSSENAIPSASHPSESQHDQKPVVSEPVTESSVVEETPSRSDAAPANGPSVSRPSASGQAPGRPTLTGLSLKDIMNGDGKKPEPAAEAPVSEPEAPGIPAEPAEVTEEKIKTACAALSKELMEERPRLGAAFGSTAVRKNVIAFRVPNDTLKEEIERNTLELKKRLMEIGDIHGPVEFRILVEEDHSFVKPIRVEDKLKFLTDLNGHLTLFRKALDLDLE